MNEKEIKKMIQDHEGFRPYVYYDTVQIPTAGYGHAFLPGTPISHEIANLLFEDDFAQVKKDYKYLKLELDPVRQGVILDMLFNLGLPRLKGFRRMLAALRSGDFKKAAIEMLDSKWRRQTGGRARRLAKMMETGEYCE